VPRDAAAVSGRDIPATEVLRFPFPPPSREIPRTVPPGAPRARASSPARAPAHARAEHPIEACGLIAGTAPAAEGGRPTSWHPARNRAASPLRFEIHPEDLLRLTLAIDDAGEVIWAIVHSHVRSPARPSRTDVGLAFYPEALHLIVSLTAGERSATGADTVRAWRIVDGAAFEVALVATDG
jgi:proteasome lid subunit RPN8/RPN11